MKSFIVDTGATLFNRLRWISLFHPISKIFPRLGKSYGFIEWWVLGNFSCSIIFLAISTFSDIAWWEIILLSFAGLRIFEIIVYQINVLLFDQYRRGAQYVLRGVERIIILLLINYIEILFWFALFYRNSHAYFDSKHILLNSFSGSLYYSIITMSTLGYGDITPLAPISITISSIQTLIGIFMALLIIARFISLLPKPKTIEREKNTFNINDKNYK
jgi:hypothetical protein